ncbi:hypothetical protein H7E67_03910 [Clostridium gasigenes]|uniref:hypothetical protein n=1 Tax=Clostridium gasigenes TaxID=94869 RepID=UPI001626CD7B|nr:hypothetical protein [Clostridium gasigenes]MBB6622568.1 hypothetical protein [Clostridium gasigenes]
MTPICSNSTYGWYDKDVDEVQVVFLEITDNEDNYADDEATTVEHYYQVSIFSKGNSEQMKIDIKREMKKAGFLYQDGANLPEKLADGSMLYHKATRWLYTESLI